MYCINVNLLIVFSYIINKIYAFENEKSLFKVDESVINEYISECRLKSNGPIFSCISKKLSESDVRYRKNSDVDSLSSLRSFTWMLSLPVLHPNTVVYNQEPLEIYQNSIYRDHRFVIEPKFGSLFYRVPLNEYYKHLYDNKDNGFRPGMFDLRHKLGKIFELWSITIGHEVSYTIPHEKIDSVLHGDEPKTNLYTKLFLMHLDYKIFAPLKRKAIVLSFLNKCNYTFRYKLRKFAVCLLNTFKSCKLVMNKEQLLHRYNISNIFKNVRKDRDIIPFVPFPFLGKFNDIYFSVDSSSQTFTNTDYAFFSCIETIVNELSMGSRNVNAVFGHLNEYLTLLKRASDVKTLSQFNGFYILEIWPKQSGFSFFNLFDREYRAKIWNSPFKMMVTSHISNFIWDLPVFIMMRLLYVSLFVSIAFFIILIFYVIWI